MILIPISHFHMEGFTLAKKDCPSLEARAQRWTERLDKVLSMDLPFHKVGLAHLASYCIEHRDREKYIQTLDLIQNDDMYRLFKRAAELGCGIELNLTDMTFADHERESVMRRFHIAKDCGFSVFSGPTSVDWTLIGDNKELDVLGVIDTDTVNNLKTVEIAEMAYAMMAQKLGPELLAD